MVTGRVWMVAHCYGFGYGLGYRIAGLQSSAADSRRRRTGPKAKQRQKRDSLPRPFPGHAVAAAAPLEHLLTPEIAILGCAQRGAEFQHSESLFPSPHGRAGPRGAHKRCVFTIRDFIHELLGACGDSGDICTQFTAGVPICVSSIRICYGCEGGVPSAISGAYPLLKSSTTSTYTEIDSLHPHPHLPFKQALCDLF